MRRASVANLSSPGSVTQPLLSPSITSNIRQLVESASGSMERKQSINSYKGFEDANTATLRSVATADTTLAGWDDFVAVNVTPSLTPPPFDGNNSQGTGTPTSKIGLTRRASVAGTTLQQMLRYK